MSGSQARRSGPDDGDLFVSLLDVGNSRGMSFGFRPVQGETLDRPDGDRLANLSRCASLLAGMVADPAADDGKGVVLADVVERLLHPALGDQGDVNAGFLADRTGVVAGRGDDFPANQSRAPLVFDVLDVFIAEMSDGGKHWIGGRLAESAQRGRSDRVAQILEFGQILFLSQPLGNPDQYVIHLPRPDAAGHAFTAGFFLGEMKVVAGQIHHAVRLIQHDHPARTHGRAGLDQVFVVDGQVQHLGGDASPRRAAGLHGLDFPAVLDASADIVDDLAERDAHRHFDLAGVADFPDQGKNLRPLAVGGADLAVPLGAPGDDQGNVRPGLDIVDVGGFAPQPGLGRKRGPLPRRSTPALDRGHQGSLLAADKSARALDDLDVEMKFRAQDGFPEQAPFSCLVPGENRMANGQRSLHPDIDVAFGRSDRIGTDDQPFDDTVGIGHQDAAVHKGARVSFVGVADDISRRVDLIPAELPFPSGRESPASPSP